MARVRLSAGRARLRTRGASLDRALVAAGQPPILSTYEETQGSPCHRFFTFQAIEASYSELGSAGWPTETAFEPVADGRAPTFRDGNQAVYVLPGAVVLLSISYGNAHVSVAASSYDGVVGAVAAFQELYPATYLDATADRIPITFWTHGRYGPEQRLRMVDSSSWEDVERNYPADVRAALAPMMRDFVPGKDGQLILWQGPPGTGKTWALRALASEWLSWAEFSYITDPDAFFVDTPSYMIDVLLSDSYGAIDAGSGDVYEEAGAGKWRVLILEDTGELLSATAKEKYGQGLSRLLNVVDGMIGQGLRVLCLVTTNDELGELNPAVLRAGRCAAQIVFPPFSADEASEWLGETVDAPATVAELYARRADGLEPLPETFDEADLTAAASPDVEKEIVRVAAAHADDAIGYGETAWDAETGTVYWIHGDWTSCDAATSDFAAIDGVSDVVCEAEAIPDGWWGAKVVYPDPAPKWVTERPEQAQAALAAAVALAATPFTA